MDAYKVHAAAEHFPLMSEKELQTLAEDIKQNGLIEPIWLYANAILDGRNRLAACKLAGVEPTYQTANLNGQSPTLWVISKNLNRRHLTTAQRAAIAAEMVPLIQAEQTSLHKGGRPKKPPANLPEVSGKSKMLGEARHIAGQAMGVGGRTVQHALRVKRENPARFERIKRGEDILGTEVSNTSAPPKKAFKAPPHVPGQLNRYENAARRRLINGLSQMRGLARGLGEMNLTILAGALTTDEQRTWLNIAREIRRQVSAFITGLNGNEGERNEPTIRVNQ